MSTSASEPPKQVWPFAKEGTTARVSRRLFQKTRRREQCMVRNDVGKVDKKDINQNASAKHNAPHKVRCATWERWLAAGPPGGIRTPALRNRNPLRYPATPRADLFNYISFFINMQQKHIQKTLLYKK